MIVIKERNTIQKQLVLDTVIKADTHPTADDVYAKAAVFCPTISRATVYRILNGLAADGRILRVAVPGAPDRFDHTLRQHSHFFCNECGRVFDYNLGQPITAENQLNPDYTVESIELVFRGHCKNCRRNSNGSKSIH